MDNGSGNASVHGVSLSVSTDILANESTGQFQLNATSCSFSIDAMELIFSGESRWVQVYIGIVNNQPLLLNVSIMTHLCMILYVRMVNIMQRQCECR